MATKKKRIVVALDSEYIAKLDQLAKTFNTKQYSKVIKRLIDILTIK